MFLDTLPREDVLVGKGNIHSPTHCIVGPSGSTSRRRSNYLDPLGQSSISLIEKLIPEYSIDWDDLYLTNLIKLPLTPTNKLRKTELDGWDEILIEELKIVRPERILAIGSDVSRAIIGERFQSIVDDHGSLFELDYLPGTYVIPTNLLSSVARTPSMRHSTESDLKKFFAWPLSQFEDLGAEGIQRIRDIDSIPWDTTVEVVIDIETTGLELESMITLIGFQIEGKRRYYMESPTPQDLARLVQILKRYGTIVIGHNLPFDLSLMMYHTPKEFQYYWKMIKTEDTMLLAHNKGQESSLGLKHLTSLYTPLTGSHTRGSYEDIGYLAQDLEGTSRLRDWFEGELSTYSGKLTSDLAPFVATVRVQGVHFDRQLLQDAGEQLSEELLTSEDGLFAYAGARDVNFNSPQQVAQFLIDHEVPLSERTKAGNLSVAESVLTALVDEGYELPELILDYRAKSKLLTGFVQPYLAQETSFVHPRLILEGAVTGRLSCRDPNLQQIPRTGPFKSIFTPRRLDAFYGLVDLAQAELRVAAFVSQDEVFADALLSEDVHKTIASMAFAKPRDKITPAERKASKAITFGLLYGGSVGGLAKRAGLPYRQVEDVEQNFMSAFPKLGAFMKVSKERAKYIDEIETLFGRRRNIAVIRESEGVHGAFRKMVNTPIQSVASDIMLSNIRYIWNEFVKNGLESKILFGVHDSSLLEIVEHEEEIVVGIVQDAFRNLATTPLSKIPMFETLPMIGELIIGRGWAQCESTSDYYDPLRSYHCSSLE